MLGNRFLIAAVIAFGGEVTATPTTADTLMAKSPDQPEVAGIGVHLREKAGKGFVVRVLPNTPASEEGSLQAGDEIVAIAEGEATPVGLAGKELGDMSSLIRGRVGTEIRLTVISVNGETERVIRLVRGSIEELLVLGQDPLPVGAEAPPLVEFRNLESDATLSLASLDGTKVVLKFWSTGCRPCLRGIDDAYGSPSDVPEEQAVAARVLLVSIDDKIETARKTVESRGWTGGEFVWGGYEASKQFRLPGLPCTIVIDADGHIESCVLGAAYDAQSEPENAGDSER